MTNSQENKDSNKDATGGSNTNANSSSETKQTVPPVQRVIHHIPLPPFDAKDVGLWLDMVKARLNSYDVPEAQHFKRIRADMPKQIAQRLPDLLFPKKDDDNWGYFKRRVTETFGRSRKDEISELLDKVKLDCLLYTSDAAVYSV